MFIDGFGMLTAPGPGQASVTSEHRLAFWGKSLELLLCLCLLKPWLLTPNPGNTLQKRLDQPKTQLNHRSGKSPMGLFLFFVLSSKNLSKDQTLTCHSEGCSLLLGFAVLKLWYSSSRQRQLFLPNSPEK